MSQTVEIAVSATPRVLSNVSLSGCIAAVWERHPLPSFQTWLNGLDPELLPQARLILHPKAVNDAIMHACLSSGMPDCLERDMLAGDIAALADIFAEVVPCDYLRVRLIVIDGNPDFSLRDRQLGKRLWCVYRGPTLMIGCTSTESFQSTPVSNGVPFVVDQDRSDGFDVKTLRCRPFPSEETPATSLVLTIDAVGTAQATPDFNAKAYH
jgi:hypothetical protein